MDRPVRRDPGAEGTADPGAGGTTDPARTARALGGDELAALARRREEVMDAWSLQKQAELRERLTAKVIPLGEDPA
ncbi:MAG: hypothetical protein QG622_3245 [Actinomycetota bacterium]|nr:hypothetical protein [Actinomycetota bacterium]